MFRCAIIIIFFFSFLVLFSVSWQKFHALLSIRSGGTNLTFGEFFLFP
jgi:hypothetical protein